MSTLRNWIQASRPLAQANLAAPLLLGQAIAFGQTERFDLRVLIAVGLWGVLDQLFIVFANDYADRDDDEGGEKKTLFSGGSGVIPEGKIAPPAILRAAVAAYVALGVLSVVLATQSTLLLLPLWLAAGALLWAYSFPPIRLSYRGGGEWLQALGVGAVLPLVGYGAQAGSLDSFPWLTLLATMTLAFAGNVATALPDLNADRRANKRTWPVRFGVGKAAWGATGLAVIAIYLAIAVSPFEAGLLALSVVALLPNLRFDPRKRTHRIRFVFFHGLATQALLLGWAALFITV